jgi:hypothetical protein
MGTFMDMLRSSSPITQTIGLSPVKASVGKVEWKARNVLPWSKERASIHATRDILSAPIYGATKPNEFISISGNIVPTAPVVVAVPTIAGSNIPQGGK